MKDIIILKSRDGTKNYLERIGDKKYLLKSEFDTLRVGTDAKGYYFVDPSGGPFISRGMYLEEAKATVDSIEHEEGRGFVINFEE